MRLNLSILLFLILVSFVFQGCDAISKRPADGKVVASVSSHNLYNADLEGLVAAGTPAVDSAATINGYVDQWVRKMVVISEAEEKLSSTIDIDKLVADYKASLVLSSFRQLYIKENLDTLVTADDVAKEYEVQKDNFILAEGLSKFYVAKVNSKKSGMEAFYKHWLRDNLSEVMDYCEAHAEAYEIDSIWRTKEEIFEYLPIEKFSMVDIGKKGNLQKYYKGYEYFVKILDIIDKGDLPPLSYVEDKLKELIIHKRKKQLLEKLEIDLYSRAFDSKKIKIFKQ